MLPGLDAAVEAMTEIDRMNRMRRAAGKSFAAVDLALHLGEVLYGNIGAADRLDFTVIGPAVNEVARIETLCEPLGRNVLVSAELAAAAGQDCRLVSLGRTACAVYARHAQSMAWSMACRVGDRTKPEEQASLRYIAAPLTL